MKCGTENFNLFILVLLNDISILMLFCPLITNANYSLQSYSSSALARSWLKICFPPEKNLDWVVFSYGTNQLVHKTSLVPLHHQDLLSLHPNPTETLTYL